MASDSGGASDLPQSLHLVGSPPTELDRHRRGARTPDARSRSVAGEPGRGHLPLRLPRRSRWRTLSPPRLADAAQLRATMSGSHHRRPRRPSDDRRGDRSIGWLVSAARNAIIRILDNRTYAETISAQHRERDRQSLWPSRPPMTAARICESNGPMQISGDRKRLRGDAERAPHRGSRRRSMARSTACGFCIRRSFQASRSPRPIRPCRRRPSIPASRRWPIWRPGLSPIPNSRSRSPSRSSGQSACREHAEGIIALDSIVDGAASMRSPAWRLTNPARPCTASARRSAAAHWCARSISPPKRSSTAMSRPSAPRPAACASPMCRPCRARPGVIAASPTSPIARRSKPRRRASAAR